jgi:BlaI family penicillinase repressor
MARMKRIADSEWEIIKILLKKDGLSGSEVQRLLKPRVQWAATTVKTLLARLVRKGILGHRTEGKTFLYSLRVPREQLLRDESEAFSRRVFDNMSAPMIAFFVRNTSLTKDDLKSLRSVLREKENRK